MPTSLERFAGNMRELFRRRGYQLNYYEQSVPELITFTGRSFKQLENLYVNLCEVRIIEDFIGDAISKIPAGVFDRNDNEVSKTELNKLVAMSNPEQSWQELLKEALVYYGLTGNCFVYWNGSYLYTLETSATEPMVGLTVEVPEFRNYVDRYRYYYEGLDYILPEADVFHMKAANLESGRGQWVYGSSPYSAAIPNIEGLESNNASRVGMIRDRGALGFVTNDSERPDKGATESARDKMEEYGLSSDKKGKFVFTTQKLRFEKMTLSTEELQLLENLNVDFGRLCMVRGVDPLIFSMESATYANQTAAYRSTVNRALIPMALHFYDKFNQFIKPWAGQYRLKPKIDEIPEFGELGIEQSARIVNEVNAGVLSRAQGLELLYPDLTWTEDEPQMVQVVRANQTNGGTTEEEEKILAYGN